MHIKLRNELIPINLIVLILVLSITFLPDIKLFRIALGLPFLLFLPGYTLLSALFPKKSSLDSIERVALSFGLSIAIVPLIGLILNYTPWGIRLEPVLYSISFFVFATSTVGWWKRKILPEEERFVIEVLIKVEEFWGRNLIDRILSVILILAILGTIGTLIYVVLTPKVGERFTEFYILGLEGKAEGYPKELLIGEEGKVIVGIVNREHELTSYQVEISIDGSAPEVVSRVVLAHDQKWEEVISFKSNKAGDNQKVEFLFYKYKNSQVDQEPLSLHLWINIKEIP